MTEKHSIDELEVEAKTYGVSAARLADGRTLRVMSASLVGAECVYEVVERIDRSKAIFWLNPAATIAEGVARQMLAAHGIAARDELREEHEPDGPMRWFETPESSNVENVAYDPQASRLYVIFRRGESRRYDYSDVPVEIYEALRLAKSASNALDVLVKKGSFAYQRTPAGE